MEPVLDKISYLIILRALFILDILEKGWSVKKGKINGLFEIYKNIKKINK